MAAREAARKVLRARKGSINLIASRLRNKRGGPLSACTVSQWFNGLKHAGIAEAVRTMLAELAATERLDRKAAAD